MDVVVLAAGGTGFATHGIPVPAQPGLLGGQWFFQAATLGPAGLRLSAALRIVVGR
jgi:hypothetical protein